MHVGGRRSSPCQRAQALPSLLRELNALSPRYSQRRILLSKMDSHSAFRNVSISPDCAQSFADAFDELIVVELRLTSGWTVYPAFWGIPPKWLCFSTVTSCSSRCDF